MNDISTRSADFAVRPRVSNVEHKTVPGEAVTPTVVAAVNVPASNVPAGALRETGKARPVTGSEPELHAPEVQDKRKVEQAVARLNDYVQSLQRDIVFSVDQDSGRSVVRVIERGTQEVIRQIPSEVALTLARNLQFQSGGTQPGELGLLRVKA